MLAWGVAIKINVHLDVRHMNFCFQGGGPRRKKLKLQSTVKLTLCGVACIDNWILMISSWSPVINAFTASPPYHRLTDIQVEGLMDPSDIIACHRTGRLYVADSGRDCVWCFTDVAMRSNSEKFTVRKFKLIDVSPLTLSTSHSGRLIVTPSSGNRLYICDQDAVVSSTADDKLRTKQIELPDFMRPQHAVETGRGTIVVCHVGRDPADEDHDQVSEIHPQDGRRVLRSFGGRRGGGPRNLGMPMYIAVDPYDSERFYIADGDNQRIVTFSWKLAQGSDRVRIDGEQLVLERPTRLCYDAVTSQLLVNVDTAVNVYHLR